jgi:hypothetical protein
MYATAMWPSFKKKMHLPDLPPSYRGKMVKHGEEKGRGLNEIVVVLELRFLAWN